MKLFFALQLTVFIFFPTKMNASSTYRVSNICENFAAGNIDALKTLEALDINIDDYSIGLNNTAKIFCS